MAQPDRITQPYAESILGPTVAAFSVFMLDRDHLLGPIEERLRRPDISISTARDLDRNEFAFQLYHHQILSAAYSILVFTWERYRKAVRYSGTPEGSVVFGLNRYGGANGRLNFEADFSRSFVDEWSPGRNLNSDYWFASVLRNAIAHGQVSFASGTVNLYNVTGTGDKNFTIRMGYGDFRMLIIRSLISFMDRVGPVGGFTPLSAMLNTYR
jgi:hypothetical protein